MGRRLPPDRRLRELEAIYREHHRRVRWTMRARAVPEGELDDLVHDAFVAIFARMGDRDPSLSMSTWVVGVARNVAFSHRRSYARRRNAPQPDAPLADPEPDEALARRRAWGMLEDFLRSLDATQREVFVLADVMGMRIPEVAGIVDAPLNTLYSRLRIARRRFSERFGDAAEGALRDAAHGEAPRRDEVQRAWLALAAKLLPASTPTLAIGGATTKWLLAGIAAVGVATVITIAPRDDAAPRRNAPVIEDAPRVAASTSAPPPVASPPQTPIAAPAPQPLDSAPTLARPARAPAPRSHPAPPADAPSDDLSATVEALRDAQARLTANDPAGALAILDRVPASARKGPLAAELAQLERTAREKTPPTP